MKLLETLLKHDACDDGILYYKNNHEYVDKILKRKHITVNDDDIFQ